MWWRNKPHNQFILHCELQVGIRLCICMLQPTHPWQVACCICHNISEKPRVGLRAELTYLDLGKIYKISYVLISFHNCFWLHGGMWFLACAYISTWKPIRHIIWSEHSNEFMPFWWCWWWLWWWWDSQANETMASDNVVAQPTTQPIHFALRTVSTNHTLHLRVAAHSPMVNGILYFHNQANMMYSYFGSCGDRSQWLDCAQNWHI